MLSNEREAFERCADFRFPQLLSGECYPTMLLFCGYRVLFMQQYCNYTSAIHTTHTKSGPTPQPQVCMLNNPFPHASVVSLMTGGSEHLAVNHPACVLPHPPAAQTAHRGCEWHQVPHLRTLDLCLTICCLCCSCQSLKIEKTSSSLDLGPQAQVIKLHSHLPHLFLMTFATMVLVC